MDKPMKNVCTDTNLREMEALFVVGLGESELFCWLASKTDDSLKHT